MTMVEVLIGITFLGIILSGILGSYIIVQKYFKDGIAMAFSGETASTLIEEIVRPIVREGRDFSISNGGDTLTVTRFDSTVNVFSFVNNSITRNGSTIAENVVKIPGINIFQELEEDERAGVNFGIRNQGVVGHYKEVRISTGIKLRN